MAPPPPGGPTQHPPRVLFKLRVAASSQALAPIRMHAIELCLRYLSAPPSDAFVTHGYIQTPPRVTPPPPPGWEGSPPPHSLTRTPLPTHPHACSKQSLPAPPLPPGCTSGSPGRSPACRERAALAIDTLRSTHLTHVDATRWRTNRPAPITARHSPAPPSNIYTMHARRASLQI